MFKKTIILLILLNISSIVKSQPFLEDGTTEIYCPLEKRLLYIYQYPFSIYSKITAEDFVAVEGVPQPIDGDRLVCPFDGVPLNGYEYWFYSRGRSLPKMVYAGVTLLSKDKNGNFVWVPYELDLEE